MVSFDRSVCRSDVLTWRRMIKVSDAYSLEDLCDMEEKDMADLLEYYSSNTVPSLKELRGTEEADELTGFDGSFGFFVGWG